ncbi:hypothetical protein ACQZV8_13645 [Magnetococcales bacterium HHB-1]
MTHSQNNIDQFHSINPFVELLSLSFGPVVALAGLLLIAHSLFS